MTATRSYGGHCKKNESVQPLEEPECAILMELVRF